MPISTWWASPCTLLEIIPFLNEYWVSVNILSVVYTLVLTFINFVEAPWVGSCNLIILTPYSVGSYNNRQGAIQGVYQETKVISQLSVWASLDFPISIVTWIVGDCLKLGQQFLDCYHRVKYSERPLGEPAQQLGSYGDSYLFSGAFSYVDLYGFGIITLQLVAPRKLYFSYLDHVMTRNHYYV